MTDPPEPCFNMGTTLQDSRLEMAPRVSLEWSGLSILAKYIKFFSFWPNLSVRKAEQYDIDTLASTILVIVLLENTGIFDISCIVTHP